MNHNLFFVRVAWMNHYQGIIDDIPKGAGSYVKENQNGGEVYNFKEIRGKYYGYSRNQNDRSYDLTRIGAGRKDEIVKGFTVVFFATNPKFGGQYVIGWYKNATIFKHTQELEIKGRGNENQYSFECKKADGYLIPTNKRNEDLPKKGPGESNVWYPKSDNPEHREFIKKVEKLISDPEKPPRSRPLGRPYQPDIEKRKQVELAAMDMTWLHFESIGFEVIDVSKENKGWDLEALKGSKKLYVEVKGLSGALNCIELTPNEYKNSTRNNFVLSIVYNALSENKTIDIFEFNKKKLVWFSDKNVLSIFERTSATLSLK